MNAGESLLEIARSMGCDGSVDTKDTEGHRPLIRRVKEENDENYVQRMRDLARSVNKKYGKMSMKDIAKAINDKIRAIKDNKGKNDLNALKLI